MPHNVLKLKTFLEPNKYLHWPTNKAIEVFQLSMLHMCNALAAKTYKRNMIKASNYNPIKIEMENGKVIITKF